MNCTRKPFEIRPDAVKAALPGQVAYRCGCGNWHLTSGVRSNLKGGVK